MDGGRESKKKSKKHKKKSKSSKGIISNKRYLEEIEEKAKDGPKFEEGRSRQSSRGSSDMEDIEMVREKIRLAKRAKGVG